MKGFLPIVCVQGSNLPEAWEKAVLSTWKIGIEISTQYDKPTDPPSRDAYALINVTNPMSQPRIHKAFPGGIKDLVAYEMEVIEGIHDHWIDPEHGKWEYTYHDRLTNYLVYVPTGEKTVFWYGSENEDEATIDVCLPKRIDQIDLVVDQLAQATFTRRAQIITWQPWKDPASADPPCLQRMWFRVFDDQLVMCVDMRSNDAFKAAFMNMYAFTALQSVVASRLSEKLGRVIGVGQYVHMANSFHIYGSYFQEFSQFLDSIKKRTFAQRTFKTEEVADLLEEAREDVLASIKREKETGRKGL